MSETPSLALPMLAAEQAQKHVTMNEALGLLDGLVQLSVKDRDLAEPPVAPAEGDRYVVAAGATGAWAGRSGQLALRQNGGWTFRGAREGWRCWVDDENLLLIFNGTGWEELAGTPSALQNLSLLGVGTAADATNPFSAKLNKALWTARTAAEGGDGDLRYTMNKEAAADTLSLLLQTGFSGRAEIGLIGNDDLTFKVSADGASWTTALVVDKSTGTILVPAGTVAAPGLKVGDADTGVYQTSGKLHAALDGVEALRLSATGLAVGAGYDAAEAVDIRRTGATFARGILRGEGGVNWIARRFSNDAGQPSNQFMKARGTVAAPLPPLQNDILGSMVWQFYTSGLVPNEGVANAASENVTVVAATPSATDAECRYTVNLAPAGSATASEIFRLHHATGLSMFGANPVIDQNRHLCLRSYTVATLPAAATAARLIYVSDGTANKRLAVSDGTNWRFPDGNIVS